MVEHAMEFDADKDGKLSKQELQKFAEAFAQMHPPGGPGGPGGPPRDGAGRGPEGGGNNLGEGQRPERPKRPE